MIELSVNARVFTVSLNPVVSPVLKAPPFKITGVVLLILFAKANSTVPAVIFNALILEMVPDDGVFKISLLSPTFVRVKAGFIPII